HSRSLLQTGTHSSYLAALKSCLGCWSVCVRCWRC
ncbi:hypothetical protein CLAFUW4_14348, partial [Fulvia fulva]